MHVFKLIEHFHIVINSKLYEREREREREREK
jgi:hypothetical protein